MRSVDTVSAMEKISSSGNFLPKQLVRDSAVETSRSGFYQPYNQVR